MTFDELTVRDKLTVYAANYSLKFDLRRALLKQADAASDIAYWVKKCADDTYHWTTHGKTAACVNLDADIISEMEHASDRAREMADAIGVELRACDCSDNPLNWCTDNHAGYQKVLEMLYDDVEQGIDGKMPYGDSVFMIDPTDKDTGISSCSVTNKKWRKITEMEPGSYLDPENKKGLILGTIHNFSDEDITETCFFDEAFETYAKQFGVDKNNTDSPEYEAATLFAIGTARYVMKHHVFDVVAPGLWEVLMKNWCPPYNPKTDSRKKNGKA